VGYEQVQWQTAAEGQLQRAPQDRAEVRAEVRIGVLRIELSAPHLHREKASGVGDLLGKIDLKVPEHLAARVAPAVDRRIGGVLD
jgi:hypothetical protein